MADTLRMNLQALPAAAENHEPAGDVPKRAIVPHANTRTRTQLGMSNHRLDLEVWPVDRPDRADPRLSLLWQPDSAHAKAYRVLRHRLLGAGDPRVVAVTSAHRGEGKTSAAFNLAMALSEEAIARVLLIEANVRNPALATMFSVVPPACFAEQTAALRSSTARWKVVELSNTNLHMAIVNAEGSRPALDRVLFAAATNQLRQTYSYIVVDTPPVLESADVNVLADGVDGLLFTARARSSSRQALARALAQVHPTPVFGISLLDSREVLKA
jgi:protein-tyrosine kinase